MSRTAWIILLIIASVSLPFGRLGAHEFTGWDDPHTISLNPHFNPPTIPKLMWYWTAVGKDSPAGLYIPLTYTFWGMLAKIAYLQNPDDMGIRLNPYVYHSANVALHVLSALVVFTLLRLLVKHDWAACAGALLWGLHPVQVEPVGWASGTKDVLCGLLSFIAIWQYLQFARRGGLWRNFVTTICFVAAMLAKPTAVVVPFFALILDIFVLRRPLRLALPVLVAWFILAIPCVIWTKLSQTTIGVPTVPPWVRPFIATDSLAFYLWKLILPINLGVDYGHRPPQMQEEGRIWFTWVVPVAIAIVLFIARRRAPLLVAAGLVFVAGLLPVMGFVPFQFQYFSTVADHYLYISMLGPAMAAAWVVARFPTRAMGLGSTVVLVCLGILSFRQGRYWKDDITIFSRAIEVNPRSFVGHNNLGYGLFRRDRAQAEANFRKAIEIFPDYPTGHDNLALALLHSDRPGAREEAVYHIKEVLRISDNLPPALRPNLDKTHYMFGQYLVKEGRYAEAAEHFREALRINPRNKDARQALDFLLSRASEPRWERATQPATDSATAPVTQPANGATQPSGL